MDRHLSLDQQKYHIGVVNSNYRMGRLVYEEAVLLYSEPNCFLDLMGPKDSDL